MTMTVIVMMMVLIVAATVIMVRGVATRRIPMIVMVMPVIDAAAGGKYDRKNEDKTLHDGCLHVGRYHQRR